MLRDKEEREDLNAKEKATLKRLADEETRLTAAVETRGEEWLKSKEDLRSANAHPGNDFVTRALGT